MCKSWCEFITGAIVIIFALWETSYSKWILVIAGALLLWHSFGCDRCYGEVKMASKRRKR